MISSVLKFLYLYYSGDFCFALKFMTRFCNSNQAIGSNCLPHENCKSADNDSQIYTLWQLPEGPMELQVGRVHILHIYIYIYGAMHARDPLHELFSELITNA